MTEKFGELSKENLEVQRRKYICMIYKKTQIHKNFHIYSSGSWIILMLEREREREREREGGSIRILNGYSLFICLTL